MYEISSAEAVIQYASGHYEVKTIMQKHERIDEMQPLVPMVLWDPVH